MNCLPNQDFKSNESLVNVAGITQLKGLQQWQDKAHQNFANLHKTSTEIQISEKTYFTICYKRTSKVKTDEIRNVKSQKLKSSPDSETFNLVKIGENATQKS